MKKILVMLLALIMVVGCMSAMAEEIDWRACEGGELMMYGGCDEPHVAAVAKAFEEILAPSERSCAALAKRLDVAVKCPDALYCDYLTKAFEYFLHMLSRPASSA